MTKLRIEDIDTRLSLASFLYLLLSGWSADLPFYHDSFVTTTSSFLPFAFEAAIINKNGFSLLIKFGHQEKFHERVRAHILCKMISSEIAVSNCLAY